MIKELRKLNELISTESFIQVDIIKGYKYIDKAGEIVNLYHKDDERPNFTMDLNGLVINTPVENVKQLKVSSNVVWEAFSSETQPLSTIKDTFVSDYMKVVGILTPTKIKRVGWRNYFIIYIDSKEINFLGKKFNVSENLFVNSVSMEVTKLGDFNAVLNLTIVAKENDPTKKGLLLDLDVFSTEIKDVDTVAETLKNILEVLKNEFPNFVNKEILGSTQNGK